MALSKIHTLGRNKQTLQNGPEHTDAEGNAAQPSFCTLPLIHVPMDPNNATATLGYISSDGHFFLAKIPW